MLIGGAIPVDENRTRGALPFKTRSLGDAEMTSSVGKAFVKEVCKQFEEDRPIWEHKAHIVRPALADTDPPFMKFRKWYAQFYADGVVSGQDVWAPAPASRRAARVRALRLHRVAQVPHGRLTATVATAFRGAPESSWPSSPGATAATPSAHATAGWRSHGDHRRDTRQREPDHEQDISRHQAFGHRCEGPEGQGEHAPEQDRDERGVITQRGRGHPTEPCRGSAVATWRGQTRR